MSVSDQIQPLYKQYSDLVFRIKSLEKKFSCDYCTEVDKCLGISSNGNPNKFLNEQGDFVTISSSGFSCDDLLNCSTSNLPEGTNLYFTNSRAISALTGQNISIFNNNAGYITSAALAPYLTIASAAATYYPLTNPSNYITLSSLSAGTGISYNNLTGVITNNSPDVPVVLNNGTAINITGVYPNFTINNTAPDQVVSLTQGGTTTITGTYPNFTISSADQFTGTVTSVAALTLGTTGTDLNSTVANSTTTPVITLNVPTASATNRGALSSTDWSTFNGKENKVVQRTGTSIAFDEPANYGTESSPETGNITGDYTNARIGVQQLLIHNSGTEPTVPGTWKKRYGFYTVSTTNYIIIEWLSSNIAIYSIL